MKKNTLLWPGRDLNTQPSELESDALPLRHQAMWTSGKFFEGFYAKIEYFLSAYTSSVKIWHTSSHMYICVCVCVRVCVCVCVC